MGRGRSCNFHVVKAPQLHEEDVNGNSSQESSYDFVVSIIGLHNNDSPVVGIRRIRKKLGSSRVRMKYIKTAISTEERETCGRHKAWAVATRSWMVLTTSCCFIGGGISSTSSILDPSGRDRQSFCSVGVVGHFWKGSI